MWRSEFLCDVVYRSTLSLSLSHVISVISSYHSLKNFRDTLLSSSLLYSDLEIKLIEDDIDIYRSGHVYLDFMFKLRTVRVKLSYYDDRLNSYDYTTDFSAEEQRILQSKMSYVNPFIIVHPFFVDLKNELGVSP